MCGLALTLFFLLFLLLFRLSLLPTARVLSHYIAPEEVQHLVVEGLCGKASKDGKWEDRYIR